jgi:plasmid stabilization system protein ParE
MNVRILSVAEQEFMDAVSYYNSESPGLGFEFAAEVQTAVERIKNNPEAWTLLSRRTRRCLTNRFPFGIIYELCPEEILIVSVMHLHRHPESWAGRAEN